MTAVVDLPGRPQPHVKIRIKHLIKRFRALVAIDDVSIDIDSQADAVKVKIFAE